MSGLTDPWERIILDLLFGPTTPGVAISGFVPTTIYVGLFTTLPNDAGVSGVEVSGGGYARVAVTNSSANWQQATTELGLTKKKNANEIRFPRATTNWAVSPSFVLGFGLFTNLTGDQLIVFGELDTPIEVPTNKIPVFGPGLIIITAN